MLSFLQKMIDHLLQIRVLQIRVLQIRVLQILVLQIRVLQIRVLQIRVLQIRVLQIRVLQIQSVFYKSNPVHVLQYAKENSLESITWSEMGKQNVQAKRGLFPFVSQERREFHSYFSFCCLENVLKDRLSKTSGW